MKKAILLSLMCILLLSAKVNAQQKELFQAMDNATASWNKGDLDGYMALYSPQATMMMPTGRVGLANILELYTKYYFENGKPKQELSYSNYEFTPLGKDYALLTGIFNLKANGALKERKGTFSLVCIHTNNGWKILHDHSG